MKILFALIVLSILGCQKAKTKTEKVFSKVESKVECKPPKPVIPEEDKIILDGIISNNKVTSLSQLKAGGYIVIIRHTSRESLEGEEIWEADRISKCIPGAELNKKGIEEAKSLGANLLRFNIPVGKVISSPACRCKQTAEHSVGKIDEITDAVVYWPMRKPWEWGEFDKKLLKILRTKPKSGTNTLIFAHNNTIEALRIKGVPETVMEIGGAIIMRAEGKHGFTYHGIISPLEMLGGSI